MQAMGRTRKMRNERQSDCLRRTCHQKIDGKVMEEVMETRGESAVRDKERSSKLAANADAKINQR